MNALTYNVSLLVSILLIGAGASVHFGLDVAAIICGSLVLSMTIIGASFARKAG